MRRLAAGDRRAAHDIYVALGGMVHSLASRILQDRSLADEVTQDTFVDVIERAGTLENAEAFVPWVRRIAVNHCLGKLRLPWWTRRTVAVADDSGDPRTDAGRADGLQDLERALASLSPRTRFVVWLHEVEGYSHAEIGDLFGRSASYSKSQLARGYAQLLSWSQRATGNASVIAGVAYVP